MKRNLLIFMLVFITLLTAVRAQETLPAPMDGDEEEVVVDTSEGRVLQYGDKGEDVSQLQTRLKDLRNYNGPVSGNYMEVTRKAVRYAQEAYGLEPTGNDALAPQHTIQRD